MDRRAMIGKFRQALRSHDPYDLARVLKIPPVSATQQGSPSSTKSSETLQEDGKEWGGILSSWLDATQAALAVSNRDLYLLDLYRNRFLSFLTLPCQHSFSHTGPRHKSVRMPSFVTR